MRVRVQVAEDGVSITICADRYSPTMSPSRLAAALAGAVETALTQHRTPPTPGSRTADAASSTGGGDHPATEDVCPHRDEEGGSVRREALRLLDQGVTDAQVCHQLGISQGRLLRSDDHSARGARLDELAGADR